MYYETIENFITVEEQQSLISWYSHRYNNLISVDVPDNTVCDDPAPTWVTIPEEHPLIQVIANRISAHFNDVNTVTRDQWHKPIVNIIPPGGEIRQHIDRYDTTPNGLGATTKVNDGKHITRFNVMVQNAEAGGELFFGYVKRSTPDRSLIIFQPSENVHYVTKNTGSTPRILILYTHVSNVNEDWLNQHT